MSFLRKNNASTLTVQEYVVEGNASVLYYNVSELRFDFLRLETQFDRFSDRMVLANLNGDFRLRVFLWNVTSNFENFHRKLNAFKFDVHPATIDSD